MEAEAVRPRRNQLNFKESGSAEQNVARRKHSPPQGSRHPKLFRTPLRAANMDTESSGTKATSNEEAVPGKTDRPPPIILTSTANLIQLQKQLKSVVKENF
jgi:hypothetical protein